MRLDIYISATRYLDKRAPCFTEVTRNNEEIIKDGKKVETVSNLEEKNKKKRALRKEKKDARTLLLPTACLSATASIVSMPRFAPLFASASVSAVFVPGVSTFLLSALPSTSGMYVSVPGLSALLLFAFPSTSGMSVFVPESSASDVSVSMPRFSAFLSTSSVSGPMLESLALPSLSFLSSVSIPVPGSLIPLSVSSVPVPGLSASPSLSTISIPGPRLSPTPIPT